MCVYVSYTLVFHVLYGFYVLTFWLSIGDNDDDDDDDYDDVTVHVWFSFPRRHAVDWKAFIIVVPLDWTAATWRQII